MASEAGGMDIEEVAARSPEKIIKVFVNPLLGLQGYHCRQLAYGLNLAPAAIKAFIPMVQNLFRLFVDYDCSLLEINPLVITAAETVIALDAKINFDDNALFRHQDILNIATSTRKILWRSRPQVQPELHHPSKATSATW
jgi:succinyl-CoA synthetase beta subunit